MFSAIAYGLRVPKAAKLILNRLGGKVKKKYDQAKIPYQRVLASQQVEPYVKEALQQEYLTLNPVTLLHQIRRYQAAFWVLAVGDLANTAAMASQ